MKTKTYTVVHRYRCGGVWHEAGEDLPLCRAQADGLVALGNLKEKTIKSGKSGKKQGA